MHSETPWSVERETLPWVPRADGLPMSRADRAAVRRTYEAAITARIADAVVTLSPSVQALADDARAEISRFDSEVSAAFPTSEIAPLPSVLLRTESASSSQIENITAGARALAVAEAGQARHGSNAELVVANVDAMQRALDLDNAATPEGILAIHEALMRGQDHAEPGAFRTEQVWVGGGSASPHRAEFVPPNHSRVAGAIDDLCAFIGRTDVPLLTQVALAHAQFETIHPFVDGNGRTGRALVHAMLRQAGATSRATIPVSAGLLTNTEAYFAALTAFRTGDPNPIVARFAEATFAALGNGRMLVERLREIYERWSGALAMRRSSAIWRVLPRLLARPAVTSSIVQDMTGVTRPAADAIIARLRDAGILAKAAGNKRYVVWVAGEVTDALDEFAARARRG